MNRSRKHCPSTIDCHFSTKNASPWWIRADLADIGVVKNQMLLLMLMIELTHRINWQKSRDQRLIQRLYNNIWQKWI